MVYIPLLHQPPHSETPTLNHPRSPDPVCFSSSPGPGPQPGSLLCSSHSWSFIQLKTRLHNTNLAAVDFGPKDRATQVIAQCEIICSCCCIKIAKIHT